MLYEALPNLPQGLEGIAYTSVYAQTESRVTVRLRIFLVEKILHSPVKTRPLSKFSLTVNTAQVIVTLSCAILAKSPVIGPPGRQPKTTRL